MVAPGQREAMAEVRFRLPFRIYFSRDLAARTHSPPPKFCLAREQSHQLRRLQSHHIKQPEVSIRRFTQVTNNHIVLLYTRVCLALSLSEAQTDRNGYSETFCDLIQCSRLVCLHHRRAPRPFSEEQSYKLFSSTVSSY